ncbi:unnamed protein product [Caenorhabditis auriculariae]|uniref:RRM domain-containing protein n=1 Tax=Caenorhabditis auriculariae TaxID=2777116 RepID=A0A8S1HCZ6_9PELO|nr:unnamed protein product [Caenorhabditis auriculariae]
MNRSALKTLWMSNLDAAWDIRFIKFVFKKSGIPPISVRCLEWSRRENSRFCFVEFETETDARKALMELNGTIIPYTDMKRFRLNFINTPGETAIYVSNLHPQLVCSDLYKVFSHLESCRGAQVIKNSVGASKAAGIVRILDPMDVRRALDMKNTIVMNKPMNVKLAKYNDRNENREKPVNPSQPPQPQSPFYEDEFFKRETNQDVQLCNSFYVARSNDWFDDLEGSRWSSILTQEKVSSREFNKNLIYSRWSFSESSI